MDSDALVAVLPAVPTSAGRARDMAMLGCQTWQVEELSADVALVVTELVANAIRHAGTEVTVRMCPIARGVRIEVADESTRPLRPRPAADSDESGRGLLIVDALSHRYGVEAEERGKRVWAEIKIDGDHG